MLHWTKNYAPTVRNPANPTNQRQISEVEFRSRSQFLLVTVVWADVGFVVTELMAGVLVFLGEECHQVVLLFLHDRLTLEHTERNSELGWRHDRQYCSRPVNTKRSLIDHQPCAFTIRRRPEGGRGSKMKTVLEKTEQNGVQENNHCAVSMVVIT